MKSLLLSALAMGIAFGQTKYYIGNYTVKSSSTTVALVPYPLDTCVPNGAGSGYNYIMLFCTDGGPNMTQYTFAKDDRQCLGDYVSTTFEKMSTPGQFGFAVCNGQQNYMEIGQYLGSCASWEAGSLGVATTIIATDACTYYGMVQGYPIYSRTTCNGEGKTDYAYAGDFTCSYPQAYAKAPQTKTIGCYFYSNSSGLDIYSATLKCVQDGVPQHCAETKQMYEAWLQFDHLLDETINFQQSYSELFSYSIADVVWEQTDDMAQVNLTLSFCTEWESAFYADSVANLGSLTLENIVNDNATVCWKCLGCVNATFCSDTCHMAVHCLPESTTKTPATTASAPRVLASFILSVVLFLSFILF